MSNTQTVMRAQLVPKYSGGGDAIRSFKLALIRLSRYMKSKRKLEKELNETKDELKNLQDQANKPVPIGPTTAAAERHEVHKSWIMEHPIKTGISAGAIVLGTSHDGRKFLWDNAKKMGNWWLNGSQDSTTETKQPIPPAAPNTNEDEIDAAIEKSKTSSEIDWKAFNDRFE